MSLSFRFMQGVDQMAGLALCGFFSAAHGFRRGPEPPPPAPDDVRRILCVKFWGLGSLILLRPAVAALKRRFPRAAVHVLTLDKNRDLCVRLGLFDEVHGLDVSGGPARVALHILGFFRRLRRLRPDLVVDFEFFTRFSAVVSALSGAPRRAGFRAWEVWRGTIHNVTVPFNRYWHVEDNFVSLARALGATEPGVVPPPEVRAAEERAAQELLARLGIAAGARLLLVNVNAGELALERRWPLQRFAPFLKRLLDESDVTALLVGSRSEREYVEEVRRAVGDHPRLRTVAGELDLGGLLALMRRSTGLVTNDSGPLHLAVALGVPTVSLFGPETPVLYGPRGDGHRVLFRNLPCSPCINVHDLKRVRCIFDRPLCLHDLPEEAVHRETLALLAARPAPPSGGIDRVRGTV